MGQENVSKDNARLEALGYRQELRREFSGWKIFCVAFSIMGIGPSLASTIIYNMPYGGPISMVWGWIVAAILIIPISMALGDLASAMPTSGGLYYWTHRLAPVKYRNFLSWMVGYNSLLGNVTAASSLGWACGTQIFTAVALHNPDFAPTAAQQYGVYCAVMIFCGIYCAYFTRVFAKLGTASVTLNLIIAVITIIGLPIARRGQLNTAGFTFGGWTNLTGWNSGTAFLLSMLAPVWTICSFDCCVSISEEASNAATAVPWAMVGAVTSGGAVGAVLLIVFALCMGTDIDTVANTDLGNPLAYIYQLGFGSQGALAVWILICLAQVSMTASVVFPASRQSFAFARDGALPFSRFFYKVDSWTGTPTRTVWLIVGCTIPLGALCFADPVNYAAINAIFALAVIALYVAYGIPIGLRLFDKLDVFRPGPWYLGRWSKPNAWAAIIWMIFASVIFCFPAEPQTDAATMNYAAVVLGGVWAFAGGYYFLPRWGGRTFFTGPRTNDFIDYSLQAGQSEEDTSSPSKPQVDDVKASNRSNEASVNLTEVEI